MPFDEHINEYEKRKTKALSMGGEVKLQQRKSQGLLNARERINYLLDPDSFLESGLFATSFLQEYREKTPADGKIAGYGKINGRDVGIISNDFTVMGASSSRINSRKMAHIKEVCRTRGMPVIFLGESTGARMPDVMGAEGMGASSGSTQYLRMRETPWVSAVLGYCFGSSTWYAAMSDFTVFRKGSIMAVSSPRLSSMATGEQVDPEELGGWRLHAEVTGLADMVVDTDEEALDAIKKFLSYLPSHHNEPPPIHPVPPGSGELMDNILDLIPESRNKVYDMKKLLPLIFDKDSVFELKSRFGKSVVTALARLNGKSVGVVASNPLHKGGALDADACDKVISFLVLCDSYNIPLIFLVDQPGFLIGIDAEKKKMPGKVMNWMNALSLCTVPKISVVLRKTYGQAFLNMGGGGNAHEVAAWWLAEVSFMDPVAAVGIVDGLSQKEDPEKFREHLQRMTKDTSAYAYAATYGAQAVIDPRETREYLTRILEVHQMRLTGGVGQHLMRTWPTTF